MLEKALRGIVAASLWAARKARSLRARMGEAARRDPSSGRAAPQPDPEDAAFLGQVSEALRRLEAPGEPVDAPRPRPGPGSARAAAAVAWLGRWRERIRRHEDALLAAALLVGILVMVIHWRLSSTGHAPWPASHGARGAEVQAQRPASPEALPPGAPGPPAAQVGPAGDAARIGLSR